MRIIIYTFIPMCFLYFVGRIVLIIIIIIIIIIILKLHRVID